MDRVEEIEAAIVPILFGAAGAGIQQARNNNPEYGQGVEGYAKRFGANYADRVDGVLIGHVVMQSAFHQDPRYFYKGKGTFASRALYAIGTAFISKGDNGHWQPAYADVLGGTRVCRQRIPAISGLDP